MEQVNLAEQGQPPPLDRDQGTAALYRLLPRYSLSRGLDQEVQQLIAAAYPGWRIQDTDNDDN